MNNSALELLWIINLIRRLRSDLRILFPIESDVEWLVFINWLMTSGKREYHSLVDDDFLLDLKRKLESLQARIYSRSPELKQQFPFPERHTDFLVWFYTTSISKDGIWQIFNEEEYAFLRHGADSVARYQDSFEPPFNYEVSHDDLEFGINLIGYAHGQLGIGEDLRMTAKALQATSVPFTIYNFPPGKDIPQNDRSVSAWVSDDLPYTVNLFCMTALEQGRFFVEKGKQPLEGHYNIGYWPWELSQWPVEWLDLTCLVDEVWVSSRHIYDALAPVSPVPVLIMPMAVELGEVSAKSRPDFGLPEKDYLFCFSFDLNSTTKRKNPLACVNAFLRAFPKNSTDGSVGLVIKAHKPRQMNHEWEYLKLQAAQDPRLHIIEATLSRPDLLALYHACDCFISLHRAEGFGRGIAEALQLGLQVITTGYSGNVDFCEGPQTHLVDYQLVAVNEGEYPYGEGQVWAEPDIDHAAQLMRKVVPEQTAGKTFSSYPEFSLSEVGSRYVRRLQFLKNHNKIY